MLYLKVNAESGFDDLKTDPFAHEKSKADDPFHSHDPFAGSSIFLVYLQLAL